MRDVDYVLLGTGLAPLVAAQVFLEEGLSVAILNPDADFFREDSELPFDPLRNSQGQVSFQNLKEAGFEKALGDLSPYFPGALEQSEWQKRERVPLDPFAPFVRSRQWVWVEPRRRTFEVERLFVEASDQGFKPVSIEGLPAMGKFPGFSNTRSSELIESSEERHGVLIPGLVDFDIARYRRGLLEFIRERVEPDFLFLNAHVQWMEDHLLVRGGGKKTALKPKRGFLVFWTPQIRFWLETQFNHSKKFKMKSIPETRTWEHWSLVCRDPVDPHFVGVTGNLTLWSGGEGNLSSKPIRRLTVLSRKEMGEGASAESFDEILKLCREFLGWESLKVRSLRLRTLFQWKGDEEAWVANCDHFPTWMIPKCDGPGFHVVRFAAEAARKAVLE